jgi:hypothetical protein
MHTGKNRSPVWFGVRQEGDRLFSVGICLVTRITKSCLDEIGEFLFKVPLWNLNGATGRPKKVIERIVIAAFEGGAPNRDTSFLETGTLSKSGKDSYLFDRSVTVPGGLKSKAITLYRVVRSVGSTLRCDAIFVQETTRTDEWDEFQRYDFDVATHTFQGRSSSGVHSYPALKVPRQIRVDLMLNIKNDASFEQRLLELGPY